MKNKLYLYASLLGTAFLLTACNANAAAGTTGALAQETIVESTQALAQTVSEQAEVLTQKSVNEANTASAVPEGYVQIFIDPQTGSLVTVDPVTGQSIPYTLPSTTNQDSAVQNNNSSQAQAAQSNNSQAQATQGNNTQAQAAAQNNNNTQAQAAAQNNNNTQAQAATQNNNSRQTQPAAQAASAGYIGESRALQIALDHAGVKSSDTLFSYAKLDYDDGRYEYDVEFYAGNKEYDYNIDATTGNILSYDFDMESHYTPPVQQAATTQQQPAAQQQPQAAASTGAVSIDTAKQTALSRVPSATASHIRITTDYDDGRMVYEGKIIYNAMEYDFEIDASTGNVTEWDVESVYD